MRFNLIMLQAYIPVWITTNEHIKCCVGGVVHVHVHVCMYYVYIYMNFEMLCFAFLYG